MQIDNSKQKGHCRFCTPTLEIQVLRPEIVFQDNKVLSLGGRELTPREILWYLKPLCTKSGGHWVSPGFVGEALLMDTLVHHKNARVVAKGNGVDGDWGHKKYMPSAELKRIYPELESKMWEILRRLVNANR